MKREKDYYDYQADHSEGAAREKWKAKKDEADRRLDQLDDQKDNSKNALKKHLSLLGVFRSLVILRM